MVDFVYIRNDKGEKGLTTGVCGNCGYIKRTRNLSPDIFHDHFSNRWLNLREKDDFKESGSVFKTLKPFIRNTGLSVLDVGCGNGDQLITFEKNGFKTYGVEPSKSRSETAKKNLLSSEITNGFSENYLRNSKDLYDIIYIENVLQFVEDPFTLLKLASQKLKQGGLLYIKAQRFEWAGFAMFSVISIIRSYLDLYSLKTTIEENNLNILKNSDSPFQVVFKKGDTLNEKTKKVLSSAKKTDNILISKVASKEFLGLRSLISGAVEIKNKSMNRSMKFKVIDRTPSLPIEVHTSEKLPIVLK